MPVAAQALETRARLGQARGLVEDLAAVDQDLVGPEDERVGVAPADAERLELGQRVGDVTGRRALGQQRPP